MSSKFCKLQGAAGLSGPRYESKMAAVLFLRGVNQAERFYLGTNVDGAGAFNDVVFKYKLKGESEFRTCLLQVTHKTGSGTIAMKDFAEPKGNFGILKHCKSSCEVAKNIHEKNNNELLENNIKNCDFVIYTNAQFDTVIPVADQTTDLSFAKISRLLSTGRQAAVHLINLDESQLVDTLNDTITKETKTPKSDEQKSNLDDVMTKYPVGDFVRGLLWFTNQSSEKDLDSIVEDEIMMALETSRENVTKIARIFIEKVELWWAELNESEVLTETALLWKEMIDSRLDLMNAAKKKQMKDSTIRYTNDEIDSFYQSLSDKSVVNVTSEIIHLTSLKVGQVLEKYHSRRFIFMEQSSMLPWGREIIRAWQSIWCDVLAIECSIDALSLADELGRDSTGKKLILISKSALPGYEQLYEDTFHLRQLERLSLNLQLDEALESIVSQDNVDKNFEPWTENVRNEFALPEKRLSAVRAATQTSAKLKMVPRVGWGAQTPNGPMGLLKTPVPLVIVSHTATYHGATRSECALLVKRAQILHIESSGWSDIAYNFLVGGDGSAYVGRGWDLVGAHSHVFNPYSIGISFIGTFSQHHPPEQQWTALLLLIEEGVQFGKIRPDYRLIGHRQVSPTESPGSALFSDLTKHPHFYGGEVKSGEDVVRDMDQMLEV